MAKKDAKNAKPATQAPAAEAEQTALPMSAWWLLDEAWVHAQWDTMLRAFAMAPMDVEDSGGRSGQDGAAPKPYKVADGVAWLKMVGPMTKRQSWLGRLFGGSSYQQVQDALQAALADEAVKAVAMLIDSPGGEIDGAFDLADAFYAAGASKPTVAYCQDNAMSAGYLVASQASLVLANSACDVGSIGAYTVLYDYSKQAADDGVKVVVIRAGDMKAIGVRGAPVTDEQVAAVQGRIDAVQSLFVKAVERGRSLGPKRMSAVADASVYVGAAAVAAGLADQITGLDGAQSAAVALGGLGPRKGTRVMAADLAKTMAWLGLAPAAPDPAASAPQALAQPSAAQAFGLSAVAGAMAAAGISDDASLAKLVAQAEVGREAEKGLRDKVKKLAVVAVGAEEALKTEAAIDGASFAMLQALEGSYISAGVAKGLLTADGSPKERASAPGGAPAFGGVRPYGHAAEQDFAQMPAAQAAAVAAQAAGAVPGTADPAGAGAPTAPKTEAQTAAEAKNGQLADSKLAAEYAM